MEGDPPSIHEHRPSAFISIHSLRMEGDHRHIRHLWRLIYFNPLPPHGGRRMFPCSFSFRGIFQSTPSAWRETRFPPDDGFRLRHFNPLPPHGGRPVSLSFCPQQKSHFNPLPPHGGRQDGSYTTYIRQKFQSTPSAWRET